MGWMELIEGAGQVLQGLSDVAIFTNWLRMDDRSALNSIEAQVQASSPQEIDRMDVALLQFATNQFDPTAKERAIKFYAMFKMAELVKYGQFRGFPH